MFSALQHCHSDPLSKHHSCYNYQLLSCGCFNTFTKAWFWYLYFAQLQLFVSIWRLYLFNAHVILFYNGFLPLSISGVKENVSFFVAANWWFSVPANGLVIDEAWTWPHRHWHATWKFRKKKRLGHDEAWRHGPSSSLSSSFVYSMINLLLLIYNYATSIYNTSEKVLLTSRI